MQLRHIEACHAVLQTGAIARAARVLGVSQPAVSKLIKHAEQQLGFRLFERLKGRLVPTREAILLSPEIEKLFHQLNQVQQLSRNLLPSRQDRIRIGCIPSLGLSLVPRVIKQFQARHPDIRYEVRTRHTSELIDSLMAQRLDIALTFDPEPRVGIRAEKLCQGELLCVRSAERPSPSDHTRLTDIDPADLISLIGDDPLGRLLDEKLKQAGIVPAQRIQVQTYYVACSLAENGCGIAIVDAFTANSFRNSHKIHISKMTPAIRFNVYAVYSDLRPLSHYASLFVKRVKSVCLAEGQAQ
ncbi:MAG: LysR substrate-binding domain-containing protein [Mesorhizobium sp.]